MEEIEHGHLTVQELRKKTNPFWLIVMFLPVTLFYVTIMIVSPFVKIGSQPTLLMNPKTYIDFAKFYATFIPAFFHTVAGYTLYWVLPIRTSIQHHENMYKYFKDIAEERGIKFEIEAKVEYPHYY